MTWKKKVGKEKSVLVIIGNKQIHQFLHLEFLIPNECTYTEHAHPSIHPYIHPLYAHISSILQMSLTNWVKFQPKFDAQILHQTKWEREREREITLIAKGRANKMHDSLSEREKREREREREEALELLSSLIMASLLKDFRREEKLRLAGWLAGWLSPFPPKKKCSNLQKHDDAEITFIWSASGGQICQPKFGLLNSN